MKIDVEPTAAANMVSNQLEHLADGLERAAAAVLSGNFDEAMREFNEEGLQRAFSNLKALKEG